MADIRRELPGVQPNNYVRQGVVDTSLATAIQGVGNAAINLDVGLAKERLTEDVEEARTEYLDQSPATESGRKELQGFVSEVQKNDSAREQGKMSYTEYQLRVERLTREAIARRPGLAEDFRRLSANYAGGPAVDFLAEREREMMRQAEAKQKTAADAEMDRDKLMQKEMIDAGFVTMGLYTPGTPEFRQAMEKNFPAYQQWAQANLKSNLADQQVKMLDASKKVNASANTAAWTAKADALNANIFPGAEAALTILKNKQLTANPAAVRQVLQTLLYGDGSPGNRGFSGRWAELEAAGGDGTVDSSVITAYRQRFTDAINRVESIMSGADDKALLENAVAGLEAEKKLALFSNDEFLTFTTLFEEIPTEVRGKIASSFEKALLNTTMDVMLDKSTPSQAMSSAPQAVSTLVDVFLKGGKSPDPIGVQKMTDMLVKYGQSYYLSPDETFNAANFTGSTDAGTYKVGYVAQLVKYAPQMTKAMTTDQKEQVAQTVAAGADNSIRVLLGGMFRKMPSLQGKVDVTYMPKSGAVFLPKGELSPTEQAVLARYNKAVNIPMLTKALQAYGGFKNPEEAWSFIGSVSKPAREARAAATAPKPASASTGRTGASGGGSKPASKSPYPDGTKLQGPDGMYVVQNGVPVKVE